METENIKTNRDVKEIILQTVKELLDKMNISGEVEVDETELKEQKNIVCNIKSDESSYLIGQYGVNLQALQHLARIMARRKTEDRIDFILDVNSYRREKNESVSILAKSMAEKAIAEKREIVMRPMTPYERRLVHMELSQNDQVKTESVGEGEDRRVAIKPVII